MKESFKNDLKHLGVSFVKVYPGAYKKIISRWMLTLTFLFLIWASFYADTPARQFVTGIQTEITGYLFDFGRWYGGGQATLIVFLGLYLAGLVFKQYKLRETGLLVGEAYIFSGLITLIFKSAFGRWRPYMNQGDFSFNGWSWTNNDQFSYFSGHASVSFALSVILASTTNNVYLKALYYSFAVITCISRIYHDQHWLSDVLTGAVAAYLISRVLVDIHKKPLT